MLAQWLKVEWSIIVKDRHTDRQSEEDKIEDRTDIRSEGKDKILYLFDTY